MSAFVMKLVLVIQSTLEQHGFEPHGSPYSQVFFSKYTGKLFEDLPQLEKIFSLAYCIVRLQYIMHVTYRRCVIRLLLARLLGQQ